MEILLVVLAMLVISTFITLLVLRRLVHAARLQMRTVRGSAGLALRAATGGGAPGEVARLRQEMSRAVKGARRALRAARAVDAPEGDVASLLARLALSAHEVDGELRLLETQPDHRRVAAALPGPRSRARAVIDSAADLVDALLAGAEQGASDLSLLQAECAIEADALRSESTRWPLPMHEPGAHGQV